MRTNRERDNKQKTRNKQDNKELIKNRNRENLRTEKQRKMKDVGSRSKTRTPIYNTTTGNSPKNLDWSSFQNLIHGKRKSKHNLIQNSSHSAAVHRHSER